LAGGGGGCGGKSSRTTYYFGESTADMQRLTDANFEDIMVEILGDEDEVVEALKQHKYKPAQYG
jgi:hypothetical protein